MNEIIFMKIDDLKKPTIYVIAGIPPLEKPA